MSIRMEIQLQAPIDDIYDFAFKVLDGIKKKKSEIISERTEPCLIQAITQIGLFTSYMLVVINRNGASACSISVACSQSLGSSPVDEIRLEHLRSFLSGLKLLLSEKGYPPLTAKFI